jgi:SAM-dependent methyltransferase
VRGALFPRGPRASDSVGSVREPIAETHETYDLIAAEFARRHAVAEPDLIDAVNALASLLPRGSIIADVGCGPGRDAALLREQGFLVVGLDLSAGQLRAGGQPSAVQADMRRLPLRTGSAGAIWCRAALLHIPRGAVPAVLEEFARVVRPCGGLYLSVAEGAGEGFEVAARYGAGSRRWFTYHCEPDLTALVAAAGFAVQQVRRMRTHRDWLSLLARRRG